MKKFFRFLMAAAVLSSASVSCSNDDPNEDKPIPPKEAVQTEAISPEGVSLYASDITDSDFVIRTAMGEKAVAYGADYPKYLMSKTKCSVKKGTTVFDLLSEACSKKGLAVVHQNKS